MNTIGQGRSSVKELALKEDVRQLVILLHERRMKVIVDVNMTLGR